MNDRLTTMAWGAFGMILVLVLLAGLYLTGVWIWNRYAEFTVMRTVVGIIACGNPAEAAKLGIVCPAPPQPGQGAAPSGNSSGGPAPARPPG